MKDGNLQVQEAQQTAVGQVQSAHTETLGSDHRKTKGAPRSLLTRKDSLREASGGSFPRNQGARKIAG